MPTSTKLERHFGWYDQRRDEADIARLRRMAPRERARELGRRAAAEKSALLAERRRAAAELAAMPRPKKPPGVG